MIGGVAVVIQASPRFTRDLDISYATDADNLAKMGDLLVELGARLRGVEEDIPFVADPRALAQAQILTLTTSEGDVDLLVDPPGSPGYAALKRNATEIALDGCRILVASIEDLIAMKSATNRPQDLVDLESLEIARRRTQAKTRGRGRLPPHE